MDYDSSGRLKYTPEIHFNHRKDWSVSDEKYLIEYYELVGAAQMSLELGRTESVLRGRVHDLRKLGLMSKPKVKKYKKRNKEH